MIKLLISLILLNLIEINEFYIIIDCLIFNMNNDLILNEIF